MRRLQDPRGLRSVLEGTTAAGATDEVFEQVAVDLPESSGLGHLGQVIHTELEAKLFQVLKHKPFVRLVKQKGTFSSPCSRLDSSSRVSLPLPRRFVCHSICVSLSGK